MEDPKVLTVSREALRADLAELELRLRMFLVSELAKKADEHELASLQVLVNQKIAWADGLMPLRDRLIEEHVALMKWGEAARAGHFTEAQGMTMASKAKDVLKEANTEGWSRRERMFAAIAVIATAAGLLVNILGTTGTL
jgi:hypothetical protein